MTCGSCGAANARDAAWCCRCLERFPDPAALARHHEERAASEAAAASDAFGVTGSVTLRRLHAGGPWVYAEPAGNAVQASILTERLHDGRHVATRHTVLDRNDVPVFRVEPYGAVDGPAFTVFDPAGRPIATYLPGELRDGTGAPVARLVQGRQRIDIVERGGDRLAVVWREIVDLGTAYDEQFGLAVVDERTILERRALVAAPLVWWASAYQGPRPKPAEIARDDSWAGMLATNLLQGVAEATLDW